MRIEARGVSWGVPGKPIIHDIDVVIEPGETVGLIGPNGSGKSSLLRCLAGLRTPAEGAISYDGENITGWDARRIAQRLAFVEQATDDESDLRVADVVGLGRLPFRDRWRGPGYDDRLLVDAALVHMGLTDLRHRVWRTLSGGERQRAHIARALAQRPRGLLLDEPTNHLDVRHQLALMRLLATTPQTVLVALHDLPLAARYCDRLVLLQQGKLVASGPPAEVLTSARLHDVYEVEADIGTDALGHLAIIYREASDQFHDLTR